MQISYKSISGALVKQPIAAYPTPALPAVPIYLRSLRSTFQLSSFFATMEEEIPPWKDRRRNSTVTRSNEIDRWKIRMEEEMDEINVYTRTNICNVKMIYTTNVFTRSMYKCKYYINQMQGATQSIASRRRPQRHASHVNLQQNRTNRPPRLSSSVLRLAPKKSG